VFQRLGVRPFSLLLFIFLAAVCIPSVNAQTAGTGALNGTVTDASGSVVPSVTVTATNVDTGQIRTVTTGPNGFYSIGLLPPGNYKVRFEGAGFKQIDVPGIGVNVTETAVLDRQLEVGSQTQEVTVQGESETVETSSSALGTVAVSTTITALPLTTRNFTNLLGLSAGAAAGVFNATTLGKGTSDIAVNGQSSFSNNTQMDGVSITNQAASGTLTENGRNPGLGLVNPDAIQEFKIQTSMFDASYGRNIGASVNVVTKSGTNQFHGSAFEFFRNTDLNANDFFRNQSPPLDGVPNNSRQVLNQNQFGGVIGGPIKKDKLFIFGSYQGTRQRNGAAAQGYSTPVLPPLPTGDRSNVAAFTTALANMYCGQAGQAGPAKIKSPTCGTTGGVGAININPVAINLLELKNPDGTYLIRGSDTGANLPTTFTTPAQFTENQFLVNGDYIINSKNTLSTRYFYAHDPTISPFVCGVGGGAPGTCLPDTAQEDIIGDHYAVLKLTTILTNNFINEARISGQRNIYHGIVLQPFTNSQVGITSLVPQIDNLDEIIVTGLFTVGTAGGVGKEPYPYDKVVDNMEEADQISWSHGKHTIRAGFEYEHDNYDFINFNLANGNLTFQSFPDLLLGLPGCAPTLTTAACTASQGTTTGSFSSSISNTGAAKVDPPPGITHYYLEPFMDAFVQDDFKATSRLTLNLGLRWEYDGLPHDKYGDATNVWLSLINLVPVPGTTPATGTLAGFVVPSNYNFAANPAPPVSGVVQSDHQIPTRISPPLHNFAPRVGFAWSPLSSNKLVVRGGYGIFYDRVGQGNYNTSYTAGEPYVVPAGQSGTANYFSTLAVPYAPLTLGWTPRWANINTVTQTGTSSNVSLLLMEENYRTPIVQQWNLNVQYEFKPSWVFELGYVGSYGYHLLDGQVNQNEAQLASVANPINGMTTNTTANASIRVPYLGFAPAGLSDSVSDGAEKYNGLQATLRKSFSHGLTMQAAYTYSRAFTTVITSNGTQITVNDPDITDWAPNGLYRPHRLTVNYSYDLPLGKHEGFLDKVASGWTVSGVTVVQDGTPLTVTDSRGGTIYGFGGAATQVSTAVYAAGMSAANAASTGSVQQRLGGANGGQGWFNKTAFTTAAFPVSTFANDGKATGWGNVGPGIVLGPGQFNWDMILAKTTRVGGLREDATLQFRTEFFNTFNHPQFNNPSVSDVSKSTFGQITSTSVNPRLIQMALKYTF